jgi:TPR repeat protein
VKYYSIAKKEEFPRALNNLGAMYVRMGDKLSETVKGSNLERGIKYLKRATELKCGKAFLNYGKCYEKGLGVRKNMEKARSLYI